MEAGAVHGIKEGAYFDLYESRESTLNGTLLGTLVVFHTESFTSTLDIVPGASCFPLPEGGYAHRKSISRDHENIT